MTADLSPYMTVVEGLASENKCPTQFALKIGTFVLYLN